MVRALLVTTLLVSLSLPACCKKSSSDSSGGGGADTTAPTIPADEPKSNVDKINAKRPKMLSPQPIAKPHPVTMKNTAKLSAAVPSDWKPAPKATKDWMRFDNGPSHIVLTNGFSCDARPTLVRLKDGINDPNYRSAGLHTIGKHAGIILIKDTEGGGETFAEWESDDKCTIGITLTMPKASFSEQLFYDLLATVKVELPAIASRSPRWYPHHAGLVPVATGRRSPAREAAEVLMRSDLDNRRAILETGVERVWLP